jgi:hypothetical protein
VWYDAWLGDWVVRVPFDGVCGSALLPLEIGWFDASWAEVYRAASDVVYAHDAFEAAAKTVGEEPGETAGVAGLRERPARSFGDSRSCSPRYAIRAVGIAIRAWSALVCKADLPRARGHHRA